MFGGADPSSSRGEPADVLKLGSADRPRRALIVEDEIFVAMHLESVLEDLGLEVCEIAATGAEALEFVERLQPDVIFMDVNLRGDMDGVDAARRAAAEHDARIIFITAYGDAKTLERISSVAPTAPILQKPAAAGALEAAIKKVFDVGDA